VDVNGRVEPSLDRSEGLPQRIPLTKRDILVGLMVTLATFSAVLLVPLAGIGAGLFVPLPTLLSIYRFGHPAGFWIPGGVLALGLPLLYSLGALGDVPYLLAMLLVGVLLGEGSSDHAIAVFDAIQSCSARSGGRYFSALRCQGLIPQANQTRTAIAFAKS